MKNLEEIVQGMRFRGTLTGAVYEYVGTAKGPFKDDRVSVYRREHSDALLYMNFKDFFGSILKDNTSEVPRFLPLVPTSELIPNFKAGVEILDKINLKCPLRFSPLISNKVDTKSHITYARLISAVQNTVEVHYQDSQGHSFVDTFDLNDLENFEPMPADVGKNNDIKGCEFSSVIEAHKQAKENLGFFNRMMDEKNAKEKAKNPDSVTHHMPPDGLPSEFSSSIYDAHDHENKAVIKTLEDQNPTGGLPFTVGHYAYYAGGIYQCFGAVTQADGQQVVLYKLKGSEKVLYLPFNTFFSYVKVGNQMVPRFTCIDETPDQKMMA